MADSYQVAKNTFHDGLSLDIDKDLQEPTTMAGATNVRLLNRDNSSFVATNLKGTKVVTEVTTNYVPIAIEERNGIAYIISAEVINGEATGRGEIGTFPSPNYSQGASGNLADEYKPLMNYAGDNNEFSQKNGPFNSVEFGFSLDRFVDIELQDDFDRTVNIIFVDGVNPIRIINSGFTVVGDNNFRIIDREGSNDDNKYDRQNFSNTINLIASTEKILKIDFNGVTQGGAVQAGNLRYYFKYSTADGNETDIIGESGLVSVFIGDSVSNIRGGSGDGEETDKQVSFTLSNLDQSYSFIKVIYVQNTGIDELVETAYEISTNYRITGDSIDVVHTGFEDVQRIDINSISEDSTNIETAKTLTQIQGYLIAGNIKQKKYNEDNLLDFSRGVILGHKEEKLDIIGTEEGASRIFSDTIEQNAKFENGTDGWNASYHNPMNIYKKLGYFGGEAYPFGIIFIYPDGRLSNPFPVIGYDNVNNNKSFPSIAQNVLDEMLNNDGFRLTDPSNDMLNTKGIYRFPNRNEANNNFFEDNKISINGVTFQIPVIPQGVKGESVGCMFVRSAKKKDLIAQGYLIDTTLVPAIDYDKSNEPGYKLWNYGDTANGIYTEDNSMLIPAYDYIVESVKQYEENGDGRSNNGLKGIDPVKLNVFNRALSFHHGKSFAFLSPDVFTKSSKFVSIFNNRNIKVDLLGRILSSYQIPTGNIYKQGSDADYFSLVQSRTFTKATGTYDGKSSWVVGGPRVPNRDRFSGGARFSAMISRSAGRHYGLFNLSYDDYVGINLPNDSLIVGQHSNSSEAGEAIETNIIGELSQAALLCNIYSNGGQRTSDQVKSVYNNLDANVYFPISGRMTWDELESELDLNRKITLFGGDCFINNSIRRIFRNDNPIRQETDAIIDTEEANLGYSISIITESENNPALRVENQFDASEADKRTFLPFSLDGSSTAGDLMASGNDWREARLPESKAYNNGYSKSKGDKIRVTTPSNTPFSQDNWFARLVASERHIPNSFENRYRQWTGLNFKDYNAEFGEIVRITNENGVLVVIQEHGIGMIGINERIQTGRDTVGSVFVESSGVFPPTMKMLSEKYGSKYPDSIKTTDNVTWGYDAQNKRIWHTVISEGRIELPSKYKVGSHLNKFASGYSITSFKNLTTNIITSWDRNNDEILFSFYDKNQTEGNKSFTLVFSEDTGKFKSFYDPVPHRSFNVNDQFYSINSDSMHGIIHLHNQNDVPRLELYGVPRRMKLSFVVNQESEIEKLFNNLELISNNVLPSVIRYYIQGGNTEQLIISDKVNKHLSNARFENGKVKVTIPKVANISNQDSTRYFDAAKDNAIAVFQQKARFKDRTILIELDYGSTKQIRLSSVLTYYNPVR